MWIPHARYFVTVICEAFEQLNDQNFRRMWLERVNEVDFDYHSKTCGKINLKFHRQLDHKKEIKYTIETNLDIQPIEGYCLKDMLEIMLGQIAVYRPRDWTLQGF